MVVVIVISISIIIISSSSSISEAQTNELTQTIQQRNNRQRTHILRRLYSR